MQVEYSILRNGLDPVNLDSLATTRDNQHFLLAFLASWGGRQLEMGSTELPSSVKHTCILCKPWI